MESLQNLLREMEKGVATAAGIPELKPRTQGHASYEDAAREAVGSLNAVPAASATADVATAQLEAMEQDITTMARGQSFDGSTSVSRSNSVSSLQFPDPPSYQKSSALFERVSPDT